MTNSGVRRNSVEILDMVTFNNAPLSNIIIINENYDTSFLCIDSNISVIHLEIITFPKIHPQKESLDSCLIKTCINYRVNKVHSGSSITGEYDCLIALKSLRAWIPREVQQCPGLRMKQRPVLVI